MEKRERNIRPKYVSLVERFLAEPNTPRNTKRIKMILAFRAWYRSHRDQLTKDERAYLQENISKVEEEEMEETVEERWWETRLVIKRPTAYHENKSVEDELEYDF